MIVTWLLAIMLVLISAPAWGQSISASASTVVQGTPITATWSGIASPVATDWIGTYTPAAANTSYQSNWVYVNCTQTATTSAASGSCSLSTSALSVGTYELRLLIADGFTSVATSSTFTVTSNPASASRFATNDGLTTGTCSTLGTACRIDRMMQVIQCGETGMLLNGTYQGSGNNIDLYATPPANPTCTQGSQITITAETDGGVFLDGQSTRAPFNVAGLTYWNFTGLDSGNSGPGEHAAFIGGTGAHVENNNISVRRHCASNAFRNGVQNNLHVLMFSGNKNSTFEDICAHGWGRNTFITSNDFGTESGNVYRRFWIRFEGYEESGDHYTVQHEYFQGDGSTPVSGNSTMENFITVYSSEQLTTTSSAVYPGNSRRWTSLPMARKGWIMYGYTGAIPAADQPWYREINSIGTNEAWTSNLVDIFVDARSQTVRPFHMDCSMALNPTKCATNSADRLTGLKNSSASTSIFSFQNTTNTNECTTPSSCPNFYTGILNSSLGARNCFRYVDGTLTSTPLWPWPMDDRVKASLARANAAGRGGTALLGSAGSGYAANTVTSEIVSRYGSVPTACLRESVFTPSFPIASDFPSVSVRDDFNRADSGTLGAGFTELTSDVFSISGNMAAAPNSGFARAIYTDTKLQVDHEVYADWTAVQSCCGYLTVLSFAGTTNLSANSQYRYEVNRQSSGNTMVKVVKIDSGGGSTTIIPEVDLGTDIADPNSFGVRVSGTTLSIYWKWTDGVWYRVGSVTDSTLSALPSTGVYGGIAGVVRSVIDNFGAGPFIDQPTQEPPSPPASVGAGRFGTTFPGVR